MGNGCSNRWKNDGRFVKYNPPREEVKEEVKTAFIPFCKHPSHIGLIADPEYRFRKCEKKGNGKFCPYYSRFREEDKPTVIYKETSIEVTFNQDHD